MENIQEYRIIWLELLHRIDDTAFTNIDLEYKSKKLFRLISVRRTDRVISFRFRLYRPEQTNRDLKL